MIDSPFFGENKTRDEYDLLMARIRKDWVANERILFTTKWFDYRHMHPTEATYCYAHELVKAYRRAFARTVDAEAAAYVSPIKEDFFDCIPAVVSGVWHGRQVADAMGVPYQVYLALAFERVLSYWHRSHMPRPQQLYSSMVTDWVALKWPERQNGIFYMSRRPEFTAQMYRGLISQKEHEAWLFEQAEKRQNGNEIVCQLMYDGYLRDEAVIERYDADRVDRIRESV